MKKIYNILELQKLSIIELTTIADEHQVVIQNGFKQGLIYAILDKQAQINVETGHCPVSTIPSELHCRDRYAVADRIATKMGVYAVIATIVLSSCATLKPKSAALLRNTRLNQQEIQYEHSVSSGKDPLRIYRHGWNAPKRMTRIPFTQLYIF